MRLLLLWFDIMNIQNRVRCNFDKWVSYIVSLSDEIPGVKSLIDGCIQVLTLILTSYFRQV